MFQVLKKNRVKHLLITFLALFIVISPLAVLGTPSHGVSAIYTEFNSTVKTEHTFPSEANYTLPWTVEVVNGLTYNETTATPSAKIGFVNYENVSLGLIDLQFYEDGDLEVYVSETDSGVKVGTLAYVADEEWSLAVADDGIKLSNSSGIQLDYNFLAFGIDKVTCNAGINDTATAGFIQLEFSDTSEFGLDIISAMLPLLVTLTMISIIIKSVNKLGAT